MKNILVTGVSKGLGLVITEKLLQKNYCVWGVCRKISPELKKIIAEFPDLLHIKQFDLAETDQINQEVFKNFVNLDVELAGVVNNAAMAYDDIVTNLNLGPLTKMYHVNVFSPLMITKYAIRNMLLHRVKGSIIYISSISVHTGYKGLAMYASTKGALEAFSKNTAREWGTKGIRSNCLVAGFMETTMSSSLTEEQKNRIYKRTSLKQPTSKSSVARMVEFLLSEKAKSITGQSIHVDSGTI